MYIHIDTRTHRHMYPCYEPHTQPLITVINTHTYSHTYTCLLTHTHTYTYRRLRAIWPSMQCSESKIPSDRMLKTRYVQYASLLTSPSYSSCSPYSFLLLPLLKILSNFLYSSPLYMSSSSYSSPYFKLLKFHSALLFHLFVYNHFLHLPPLPFTLTPTSSSQFLLISLIVLSLPFLL